MKQYDVIAVGTGSVMAVVEAMIEGNPRVQIAVIDKDEPGGICLTRGCIPSKILLYPADLVRTIERAGHFGLDGELRSSDLVAVIGGGYIAAEYGFFLAAMGADVTILGRNPQFLPEEELEVSQVARKQLGDDMRIETNHEVVEVTRTREGKRLRARDRATKTETVVVADEILVAAGRGPVRTLHPERAGIKTDANGWIVTDEYLATSQPHIWALGDATGKFPFKHKANYDAQVLYYNILGGEKRKVDYHAVPHAVFTDPEVASVGVKEAEAIKQFGAANVLIGFYQYQDTAKGEAMDVKDCFVKVLVEREGHAILGAHIVGPEASVLIQEIINLMYTKDRSVDPVREGMHIHPALSEVVERACLSLMPPEHYHHTMEHALDIRSR